MVVQVTIATYAPATIVIEPQPQPQTPPDRGETRITAGKKKGFTFAEAKKDEKYAQWIKSHSKTLRDASLISLAAYIAAP